MKRIALLVLAVFLLVGMTSCGVLDKLEEASYKEVAHDWYESDGMDRLIFSIHMNKTYEVYFQSAPSVILESGTYEIISRNANDGYDLNKSYPCDFIQFYPDGGATYCYRYTVSKGRMTWYNPAISGGVPHYSTSVTDTWTKLK